MPEKPGADGADAFPMRQPDPAEVAEDVEAFARDSARQRGAEERSEQLGRALALASALSLDLENGMRGGGIDRLERIGPGVVRVTIGGEALLVTVAPESANPFRWEASRTIARYVKDNTIHDENAQALLSIITGETPEQWAEYAGRRCSVAPCPRFGLLAYDLGPRVWECSPLHVAPAPGSEDAP